MHGGILIFSRKKNLYPLIKSQKPEAVCRVFFWARNDLVFNPGYDPMVIGNGYDQTSHASRHFHNFPIGEKYTAEQFCFFSLSCLR